MKPLTKREQEILEIITHNPQISQKELADLLGITRSSAAVHISNLTKKGHISGKGYITAQEPCVVLAGAANLDILGFTKDPLIPRDSNPGQVRMCPGGVCRNIAENLSRLGVRTELITAVGDDIAGKYILENCAAEGISTRHSLVLQDTSSSIYLALMENDGDMALALSDMTISDNITKEFLRKKRGLIDSASVIVADTCLSAESLEYLLDNCGKTITCIDPVSVTKGRKLFPLIGKIHTLKMNKLEAEELSGMVITDNKSLREAGDYFLRKGTQYIYITLGAEGVFYCSADTHGFYTPPLIKVVNATGAGDAFMAGVVFASLNQYTIEETVHFSSAAAALALSGGSTVNPNMSRVLIEQTLNKQGDTKI
ncbi:MAG: winged helix-turn-helix transcriptional regulator [Spirochaetes bacterium]|nr:winged helix-turn-helix transcriptional regulator [Spirochaetota bacterium]MBL7006611.1 winged helix-turn-helix transcriptional regulator [Spirochaetia bacterium]